MEKCLQSKEVGRWSTFRDGDGRKVKIYTVGGYKHWST